MVERPRCLTYTAKFPLVVTRQHEVMQGTINSVLMHCRYGALYPNSFTFAHSALSQQYTYVF